MISLILSAILSVEIVVIIDFCLVLVGVHYKLSLYALTLLILPVLLHLTGWVNGMTGVLLICIPLVICAMMYLLWLPFYRCSKPFEVVDTGKKELYGGKRIMVIVPHQDDEINVLGGVFEEYIKYGSEVYLVYAMTNGQIEGYRYEEALALCRHIGIPQENVFFLGYALRNKASVSLGKTHGTVERPAYHEGKEYSRKNLVDDISQLVHEKRPDIIFGSDYDYHIDHHLVSICIDETVGKVLKKEKEYRPTFVKCYAYRTTWESYPDYYEGDNICSTRYMSAPVETYRWEERLRFTVSAHILCRSLLKSDIYHQYAKFKSQGAVMRAINTNSDKVGWERRTDSILLNAEITTTSGDGSKLNDFLLYDKGNMAALDELPLSGAWIPDAGDPIMEATFSLPLCKDISYIDIYNNPSENERVDSVRLLFEDGSQYDVMLEKDFVCTRVFVNKQAVNSFVLKITDRHGAKAGITEVEAFEDMATPRFSFVKLMNKSQDFIYDYWLDKSGKETLKLYKQGYATTLTGDTCQLELDNNKCKATISNNGINVYCPKNESTILTVKSADGIYEDSIRLYNPSRQERWISTTGRRIESIYYNIFKGDLHRKATTLSVIAFFKSKYHAVRL